MKKITYSKPLARQWEGYNKFRMKDETVDLFLERKLWENHINSPYSANVKQSNVFSMYLWYSDAKKEMLHLYFMDKKLKDFLANLKLADIDGIIKYVNDNSLITNHLDKLETNYYTFGIHLPNEKQDNAYAFGLMTNHLNEIVLTWSIGADKGWCPVVKYYELLKEDSQNAKEITRIFRLAINTIAYMEAFPECIVEGVPRYVKEPRKDNNFIVNVSDKVLEYQKDDGKMMRPHFRKGYYKRLSSDFYKNKKGQIIFVSETMVNGKAKTVYTKDDLVNIDNINNVSLG